MFGIIIILPAKKTTLVCSIERCDRGALSPDEHDMLSYVMDIVCTITRRHRLVILVA